jgi:RNA polymerase sigma factor (sigma-70 family)
MSTSGVAESAGGAASDVDLVAAVRSGSDDAFEELYRRYHRRIRAFAQKRLRDRGRAEDVTQEAFLSALRRLRATDSDIAFKPWLFEIARNAAIDVHRRTSRAEEVPVDDELLRPSDRHRLVGAAAPDAEVFVRERLELLSGAFDELPEVHHRALVMRELEGLSYREIGERLELTRSAVESTLFRARRRLEHEYEELEAGRHCESARGTMALIAEGLDPGLRRRRRFTRHTRRCSACRRHARELGVAPPPPASLRERAAALLPLPLFLRRRALEASADGASAGATAAGPGVQYVGSTLAERAASLLAAAALASAGGAAINGAGGMEPPDQLGTQAPAPAVEQGPGTRALPDAGSYGAGEPRTQARARDVDPRARSRARQRRRDGWSARRTDRRQDGSAPAGQQQASPGQGGDAQQQSGGVTGVPRAGSDSGLAAPAAPIAPGGPAELLHGASGANPLRQGVDTSAAEGFLREAAQHGAGVAGAAGVNAAQLATDGFS